VVGAGPSKDYDILGLKMFDSAELRVHPTGKAILKIGVQTQGQGHETTFAQIVANELGIPPQDILVQHGDTDNTPYGLGTYASRSTPTAGAATAMVSRKLRDKARELAAHLLEVAPEDLEWVGGPVPGPGRPRPPDDHPGGRLRRLHQPPPGDGGRAWRASPTTTRPT
jgi:carbon-monoxide dehydrogenase large subunit